MYNLNRLALVFIPGIFFLLIGLSVVLAPKLLLGLVAGFFLACGALLCYLAYRFLQIKREMSKTFGKIRTEVRLHMTPPQVMEHEIEIPEEIKKIIYH